MRGKILRLVLTIFIAVEVELLHSIHAEFVSTVNRRHDDEDRQKHEHVQRKESLEKLRDFVYFAPHFGDAIGN